MIEAPKNDLTLRSHAKCGVLKGLQPTRFGQSFERRPAAASEGEVCFGAGIGRRRRRLELTVASLRAYRRRDPYSKDAIAAAVGAEADLGREDPAEGKVVIGKLVGGLEAPPAEGISRLRTELRRLMNAS